MIHDDSTHLRNLRVVLAVQKQSQDGIGVFLWCGIPVGSRRSVSCSGAPALAGPLLIRRGGVLRSVLELRIEQAHKPCGVRLRGAPPLSQ